MLDRKEKLFLLLMILAMIGGTCYSVLSSQPKTPVQEDIPNREWGFE